MSNFTKFTDNNTRELYRRQLTSGAAFEFLDNENYPSGTIDLSSLPAQIPVDTSDNQGPSAVWVQVQTSDTSVDPSELRGCTAVVNQGGGEARFFIPLNQVVVFYVVALEKISFIESEAVPDSSIQYSYIDIHEGV